MKDGMFFIVAAPLCFLSLILSVRMRRTYNNNGKERFRYVANAFLMIFAVSLTMIIALLPDFLK